MLVEEVMNKDVKTIRADENIQKAAEIMNKYRIGSLVVLDGSGIIIGILTERDVMNKVVAMDRKPSEVTVTEVMTTKVISIPPEMHLEDAADIMTKYKMSLQ